MESKGPRGFESRGLKTSGGFKESSGVTLPDVFVKLKGCKLAEDGWLHVYRNSDLVYI